MKKRFLSMLILALVLCLLFGCGSRPAAAQIAATTLPIYEFTSHLCRDTPLSVTRLVTQNISCLHNYSLQVAQMRSIEAAQVVVISGAELEEFLEDILENVPETIDASLEIPLLEGSEHEEHGADPHIWLSPENARIMARNICQGLIRKFPAYEDIFQKNLAALCAELDALEQYGKETLAELKCRELITFHDGFSYFAAAFDLDILYAVEEESGSEASAAQLIELIELINSRHLPAIFTEQNSSDAAAGVIAAETGVTIYTLDMAMAGESYFDAMYHNIDTIKEALG